MNDFERQLSHQPLRTPPPEWRAGILAGAAKVVVPSWTWRNWFWPSPAAWGALAAVWVGAFLLGGEDRAPLPASVAAHDTVRPGANTPGTLLPGDAPIYAFALHRDLSALLDNPIPERFPGKLKPL